MDELNITERDIDGTLYKFLPISKVRVDVLILALFDYNKERKFLTTEARLALQAMEIELQEMYIELEKANGSN